MAIEEQAGQAVNYTPIERMRHSAAHVLAEAVQDLYPGARFAIGPAIEDGFYYDMELPRPLTPRICLPSRSACAPASRSIPSPQRVAAREGTEHFVSTPQP
jgi:hypothetical protein